MKNFILLLIVACFVCCKKESPADDLHIIPAQPVYFTVEAQDTLPKVIHLELWSVKQGTREKGDLVARIDTTVNIHGKTTFTFLQDVKPVIYCIATLNVKPKSGTDIIKLQIGGQSGMCVRKAMSCPTDYSSIDNEFISLY